MEAMGRPIYLRKAAYRKVAIQTIGSQALYWWPYVYWLRQHVHKFHYAHQNFPKGEAWNLQGQLIPIFRMRVVGDQASPPSLGGLVSCWRCRILRTLSSRDWLCHPSSSMEAHISARALTSQLPSASFDVWEGDILLTMVGNVGVQEWGWQWIWQL